MQIFLTTQKKRTDEREYFFHLTVEALRRQHGDIEITVVSKPMLERYFEAEKLATDDIYILCDDDIVPADQNTLAEIIEALRSHPEYSQMGLGWKPNMDSEKNNSWFKNTDGEIWEADHVGGCVAVRRGTIKDFGYSCDYRNGRGDDKIVGKIARELGYKVGLVPHLWFHHLGINHSSVWSPN